MDKISFQGRTVLITSPQRYAENLSLSSYYNNGRHIHKHIRPGTSGKCDVSDGDIFVLVHNGEDGILRRIDYDIQIGAKSRIDEICEDLENFSKNIKENITCIIMGGRSRDSVTTKCVNDIANRVEGYLAAENKKADLSILCGVTDDFNSPIFLKQPRGNKVPEIYIPANIEGEVSAEKLEDIFDMVELKNMELVG